MLKLFRIYLKRKTLAHRIIFFRRLLCLCVVCELKSYPPADKLASRTSDLALDFAMVSLNMLDDMSPSLDMFESIPGNSF